MFNLMKLREECRASQKEWEKIKDSASIRGYPVANAKAEVYEIIGLKLDIALSPPTIREYNPTIDDGNCSLFCPFRRDRTCVHKKDCDIPLELCASFDEAWVGMVLINVETEELVYSQLFSKETRPTPEDLKGVM